MRLWFLIVLSSLSLPARAVAQKITTECIGPEQPKGYVIYLHGLIPPDQKSNEDGENREVLERLASEFSLRIAIPRGQICDMGKLCWPGRDKVEVLLTFRSMRERAQTCWSGQPNYSVIGFSNGGYFAFKLYKAHQDAQLTSIITAGSAGTWDDGSDKPNPYSSLAMMMGNRDITLTKTTRLVDTLRKMIPNLIFEKFSGAHRLDFNALARILKRSKKN